MVKAVKFASPYVFSQAPSSGSSASANTNTNNNNNNNNRSGKGKEKEEEIPEADVNIMSLELGQISQQETAPITGDPLFCSNPHCKAIFNSASVASDGTWTCEFCRHPTAFNLDDAEIPKEPQVDFVLEPILSTAPSDDNSMVIFCIDTSGSMCVTSEVEVAGSSKPSSSHHTSASLSKFVEKGASQRLPGQKSNVQYISRLQSVQSAVASQIEALHKSFPKKRLGIVIFNDDVQILGDGAKEPISVAGDKLDDYKELLEIGTGYTMDQGIENTKKSLLDKVKSLEEQGGTALGPALLVSCGIASRSPASKVIICTDGLANIGLGSVDDDSNKQQGSSFYEEVAKFAKQNGTTVSVVTIAGTDCSLENIGKVADVTGGQVEIVDPAKISANFASILQKAVIATNVSVSIVAHPAVTFSNSLPVIKQEIGNITVDSEVTFSFGVAPEKAEGLSSVPFQVQIEYRRPAGPLCVRVISTKQNVTSDRSLAERDVDVAVIGVHTSKKSASLVQEGKYAEARTTALAQKRMLERAVHTKEQRDLMSKFDDVLNQAETELDVAAENERAAGVSLSADLDDEEIAERRSRVRTDRTAEYMYQMKSSKAAACVVQ